MLSSFEIDPGSGAVGQTSSPAPRHQQLVERCQLKPWSSLRGVEPNSRLEAELTPRFTVGKLSALKTEVLRR